MERCVRTREHGARLSQAIVTLASFSLLCSPSAAHALQYNETHDLYFTNIEDPEDPSDNNGLRFGGLLDKFLFYDEDLTRFTFTDDLHVMEGITASGAFVTEGRNTFNGVAVFNEDASPVSHVRMETHTEENMFFLDATNDRIGIGTSTPEASLDVVGTISGASVWTYDINGSQSASTGSVLISNASGEPEWKSPAIAMGWYFSGDITTGAGRGAEITMPFGMTVTSVTLRAKTAPASQAIIVDINENGSTLFSTRPQIDADATTGGETAVVSDTALAAGSVITVDIDQVGSGTAGEGLTIMLNGIKLF